MAGVTTSYQTGNHAGRPAPGAGCILYDCTDHSLIYRSDGTTWITFATLGTAGAYVAGGTDVAVADGGTGSSTASGARTNLGLGTMAVEAKTITTQDDLLVGGAAGALDRLAKGSDSQVLTVDPTTHHLVWATPSSGFSDPMTTRGDIIIRNAANATARLGRGSASQVLTSDGTDVAWAAPGGGGGASVPTYVQAVRAVNPGSNTLTISAASSGNRIVVCCNGSNAAVTALTCTNVTFTKMLDFGNYSIWVGVVAGGSSGTSVAATTGASFLTLAAVEITTALVPTAGSSATATASDTLSQVKVMSATAGNTVILWASPGNTNNQPPVASLSTPYSVALVSQAAYVALATVPTGGNVSFLSPWTASGSGGAVMMVEVA